MAGLFRNLSLVSRGLRYKLRIAFSLMSIIPLLVCIYLFFIYNPHTAKVPFSNLQISASVIVTVIIAIIGFLVAKQIVDPIVEMSSEAKSIARGEYSKTIDIYREDEIGELGNALNQLTRRIRDNMQELRNYGEQTKQINVEINKHVVVLSGLLQISNLVTQGASLKEIYDISISKIAQLKNAAWAILVISGQYKSFKICAEYGISDEMSSFLSKDGIRKIFDSVLLNKKGWIIDKQQGNVDTDELIQIFDTTNIVFVPVYRHTKIIGFLGAGNSQSENKYDNDDLELLGIFAKQISISIENDYLTNRLLKLEIKDTLTGLYNKNFIVNRLDEEIKRAMIYQRPCAFLLLSIDKFEEFLKSRGQLVSEEILKKVSKILEENCSEIDRIARYSDHDFAIILPEKNKKQSIVLAEDIREKINEFFSQNQESKILTISGAVSENPIDGSTPEDLIQKAEESLDLAKKEENTLKS
ncbi:MAG: diguanylate cyclase [Candidatus Omnitrophica bacterium]|nr:diguanylate cyclase [Candidatus Omnitrophota bacterium]